MGQVAALQENVRSQFDCRCGLTPASSLLSSRELVSKRGMFVAEVARLWCIDVFPPKSGDFGYGFETGSWHSTVSSPSVSSDQREFVKQMSICDQHFTDCGQPVPAVRPRRLWRGGTACAIVVTLLSTYSSIGNPPLQAADDKPVSLFDGESFDGWEGDTEKTWRIEDGTITAGSLDAAAPQNEFLSTAAEYENFELRLKFRIDGDHNVNAGVQFRTRRIPDHHEVIGYQADIGEGVDGHLYDESRRRRMLASPESDTLAEARAAVSDDGWQTYRIRAEGDRIQLWLNGVQTVDYVEEDEEIERTGIIAVQIHGGMRAVISYRDIEIEELP